jgi:hypothetical protein
MTRDERLEQVLGELNALIAQPSSRAVILSDTGPQESMLIGTRDAYLRLAATLVEFVRRADNPASWAESDIDEEAVMGMRCIASNEIKRAFDDRGQTWVMASYLAEDEAALEEAVGDCVSHEADLVGCRHGSFMAVSRESLERGLLLREQSPSATLRCRARRASDASAGT